MFDYVALIEEMISSKAAFEDAKDKYNDYCFSNIPIKNSKLHKVLNGYHKKEKLYNDSVARACNALNIFYERNYVIKIETKENFIHVFFGPRNDQKKFRRNHGHIVIDKDQNKIVYSRMPNQAHGSQNHLK